MEEEEKNGAVPPKVKLKTDKLGTDGSSEAASGSDTIKVKPIKKTTSEKPVVNTSEGEEEGSKDAEKIQLKEPVDSSSAKVDLKPVGKKSETSKISLDSAVPKPITVEKSEKKSETGEIDPEVKAKSEKSKTSRISLDSVLNNIEDDQEDKSIPKTNRPKTVKLKRPSVAPKVTPLDESSEAGVTPTRKKTVKIKKPSVPSTPKVDLPAESSGPKLQQKTGTPGTPYIADRFANVEAAGEVEDKPHWIFAVAGILACIVMAVTIYSQIAQFPASGLSWIGKLVQRF